MADNAYKLPSRSVEYRRRGRRPDVMLLNPPWHSRGRWQGVRAGARYTFKCGWKTDYKPFPFFMACADSYSAAKGFNVCLYDPLTLRHSYKAFYENVAEARPEHILIETSTLSIEHDLKIARKLSSRHKILLAGPHATTFAEELVKLSFVHAVLKGEYEKGLVRFLESGRPGIYDYEPANPLDELPFPYRDRNTIFDYYSRPMGGANPDFSPQVQVMTSRGCPFSCSYCLWPHVMHDKKYRAFSVAYVLDELKYLKKTYGVKYVHFDDDTWNVGNERVSALCEGLKKLDLKWDANCRVDTVGLEMYEVMAKSNCNGVLFGVEAASDDVIGRINKKISVEKIRQAVGILKKHNVYIHLSFMTGLPGETMHTVEATKQLLKELDPSSFQQMYALPMPGTPWYYELVGRGIPLYGQWERFDSNAQDTITFDLYEDPQVKALGKYLHKPGTRPHIRNFWYK